MATTARTLHPFPARMAPEIAIDHLRASQEEAPLTVLDPMCGSGTVLAAASSNGHRGFGIDIDPLAVLISRVTTTKCDTSAVLLEAQDALRRASRMRTTRPPWDDPETVDYAEYWFGKSQRIQLNRLSRTLNEVVSPETRDVLRLALSRMIITKSPKASLAIDASHSRPRRVLADSTYDVYFGFENSVNEVARRLDRRLLVGKCRVRIGDARSLAWLRPKSIDITVTSPPYLNAIDYLRGHRLSLIWFGHTLPELRETRSRSIGSERGEKTLPPKEMREVATQSICSGHNLRTQRIISRYLNDLVRLCQELGRVTKPKGRVVMVVGNSTLRGGLVPADLYTATALESFGFMIEERVERTLPENRRYMPLDSAAPDSAMARRMRKELVITAIKG